jgi:hypothetical protein
MKSADNVEKLIKRLHVEPSAEMRARTLADTLESQENLRNAKPAAPQPNIWRTIMKNRITKLAAAVAIIVAAIAGVYNLGGSIDGASVAWGQVAQRMETIPAATYWRTEIINQGTLGSGISEEVVYLSDYAIRTDSVPEADAVLRPHMHWVSIDKSSHIIRVHEYDEIIDNVGVSVYMDDVNLPSSDPGLEIDDYCAQWQQEQGDTSEKEPQVRSQWLFLDERVRIFDTGDQRSLSEEEAIKWFKHLDPREWTKEALSLDYRELGHDNIDGVDVEGVEVQGRDLSVAPFRRPIQEDVIIRFWVDVKTGLPVRYEARVRYGRWEGDWAMVVDEIHWNEEVDPVVFEPTIFEPNVPVE